MVSSSSLVTQRSHLAIKCPRTGDCLTFGSKFQAACDGCVIGAASKGVGFEALGIQPFSDTRHYRGQFVVPTAHLNYIQHALALLRNEFKAGKCWSRDNGGWSGSMRPSQPPCSMGVSCSPSPLPPRRAAKCGCSSLNVSSSYFAGPQHRLGWCSLHVLEPSRA